MQDKITKDQALGLLFHFWNLFVGIDEEIRIADDLMTEAREAEKNNDADGAGLAWSMWGDFTVTCEAIRDAAEAIEQMVADANQGNEKEQRLIQTCESYRLAFKSMIEDFEQSDSASLIMGAAVLSLVNQGLDIASVMHGEWYQFSKSEILKMLTDGQLTESAAAAMLGCDIVQVRGLVNPDDGNIQ